MQNDPNKIDPSTELITRAQLDAALDGMLRNILDHLRLQPKASSVDPILPFDELMNSLALIEKRVSVVASELRSIRDTLQPWTKPN